MIWLTRLLMILTSLRSKFFPLAKKIIPDFAEYYLFYFEAVVLDISAVLTFRLNVSTQPLNPLLFSSTQTQHGTTRQILSVLSLNSLVPQSNVLTTKCGLLPYTLSKLYSCAPKP